jgi:hypothetical protein
MYNNPIGSAKAPLVYDFAGRTLRRAFLVLGEPIQTCPNCNDE